MGIGELGVSYLQLAIIVSTTVAVGVVIVFIIGYLIDKNTEA